jgi:hypothetical protein
MTLQDELERQKVTTCPESKAFREPQSYKLEAYFFSMFLVTLGRALTALLPRFLKCKPDYIGTDCYVHGPDLASYLGGALVWVCLIPIPLFYMACKIRRFELTTITFPLCCYIEVRKCTLRHVLLSLPALRLLSCLRLVVQLHRA